AGRLRLEISDEPVCYPVWRAIHAGARITRCSTASPTKMRTGSGIVTVDHTRAAIALEQGITSIPATLHLPTDPLPPDMVGRFGNATTWGDAAAYRAANQRPPLPPTGTTTPPKLPKPKIGN
ncbi:hypothetical protein, partial [Burkholderia vietnamiensis]|uniref:hypothetical protein n=1 Tax=Burkholderia vietnamiensis TaxID=60552 RepID=UPI001CF1BE90